MNERRKEGTEGRQKGGRKGKGRRKEVREGGREGRHPRFKVQWMDGRTDGRIVL